MWVQFGGTGVMAFHTDTIKFSIDEFKYPNMADIWVGLFAQRMKIPVLAIKHRKGWIRETPSFDRKKAIGSMLRENDSIQTRLINEHSWELLSITSG
jgi:hypothetical protein